MALSLLEDNSAVVMDIGADNGLFSLALKERDFCVYASENKKGPYENLCRNVGDQIKTIFTDGIDILPPDVDTLVLLGMGGKTIWKILHNNIRKLGQIETILIEPQSQVDAPCTLLEQLSFVNDKGLYVHETGYYPILRYVRSVEKTSCSVNELSYGPYPYRVGNPLLIEKIKFMKSCNRKFVEENISSAIQKEKIYDEILEELTENSKKQFF